MSKEPNQDTGSPRPFDGDPSQNTGYPPAPVPEEPVEVKKAAPKAKAPAKTAAKTAAAPKK